MVFNLWINGFTYLKGTYCFHEYSRPLFVWRTFHESKIFLKAEIGQGNDEGTALCWLKSQGEGRGFYLIWQWCQILWGI